MADSSRPGGAKRDEAATLAGQGEIESGDVNFCRAPSPEQAARCADIRVLLNNHDDYRNAAVGLFIGGGVLAAGAVALLVVGLTGDDDPDATGRLEVTPVASPHEGGFIVRGRW